MFDLVKESYDKILKISPAGDYIFQRPFLRGLFLEEFIYGGKFPLQQQLYSLYKKYKKLNSLPLK